MLRTAAAFALCATLLAAPAAAANRNYSVTSFDRVRVDGPYAVTLATGRAPSARATGSAQALDALTIEVQGRTLVVRPGRSSWGGYPGQPTGPVTVELSTHELAAVFVNGAGSVTVDRVKGLAFESALQGSGSLTVGELAVDRFSAGISGAGTMTASGKALKATAIVRGTSSFDGTALSAKDATLGAEGPSRIALSVSNAAQVSVAGLAQVTLTGRPACTIKASGSAAVSGCR